MGHLGESTVSEPVQHLFFRPFAVSVFPNFHFDCTNSVAVSAEIPQPFTFSLPAFWNLSDNTH